MARRLPLSGVCALAFSIVLLMLIPRVAFAAPNDAAAQKLRKEAIHTDFLATNFAEAGTKLKKAVALCQAPADCTPAVRALVLCDLGVIEFTLQHPDAARADFAAAQKEDPTVMLDKDLSSPGLEKEFEAAKALVAATPASKPAAPPTGDMTHIPVTTQSFLTPIPIYVELPAGVAVDKVIVRYKGPTASDWKTATMTKMGTGWGVELPCQDVGTAVGTLKYYVQGQDASGDLVSSSGRLSEPYTVSIVQHAEGEAAHLPDKPAPAVCQDVADCPPSFPGCHSAGTPEPTKCETDADCADAGGTCMAGVCATKPPEDGPYKRNWVSLSFQQDMLFVPGATDACAGGTGYTCFDAGTSTYYPQTPLKGADDVVAGGIKFATSRILAGYDRAFLPNLTLGARVGFAFGGGPQRPGGNSFVPVHLELRAAYWFGHNPLARSGFRFYVTVAGGIAEVDTSVAVDAYANVAAYKQQPPGSGSVNYDAWTKTGTGFISGGPGLMYAIRPWTGILIEVKVAEEFPTAGTGLNGTIAYVIGF